MSLADVRHETRKTMAVNLLLESTVWKSLTVPQKDVQAFYERNKEEFKHPAQTRASHFSSGCRRTATPAERHAAEQQAAALLAQLQPGADFAQLAREHSQDPASAARGGDLGYFAKGNGRARSRKQPLPSPREAQRRGLHPVWLRHHQSRPIAAAPATNRSPMSKTASAPCC